MFLIRLILNKCRQLVLFMYWLNKERNYGNSTVTLLDLNRYRSKIFIDQGCAYWEVIMSLLYATLTFILTIHFYPIYSTLVSKQLLVISMKSYLVFSRYWCSHPQLSTAYIINNWETIMAGVDGQHLAQSAFCNLMLIANVAFTNERNTPFLSNNACILNV